jgi:very-short-patch-repair endonuclease
MLNPKRDPALMNLAVETAGAIHVDACHAAGLSDRRLYELLRAGRWQSPFPRVYVTFSGPIPLLTLEHAALLYAGDGAALSRESAGCYWHLCRQPAVIHVTVPYLRDADDQPGLMIHRSRTLTEDDVHPVLTPRRTRVERTVLDLLADKHTADAALGLVADAIRQRATTVEHLRVAFERRPTARWRKVVLEALPDLRAGAQSTLEIRDAKLRRRHGLPMGARQFARRNDGTEYLDIVLEEWRLHVELDGRLGHDRAREIWRDMKRDNRSEVAGFRHLRYGWTDMIDRPCQVAIEQGRILRQQGWTGRFKRCKDCPSPLPLGL